MKTKNKKIKLKPMVLCIFVSLVIGALYGYYMNNNSNNADSSAEIVTEQKVEDFKFVEVGKLVTQEWYGTIISDTKKDRKLFDKFKIPGTQSRLLFGIDVKVTAGVNFENITYELIDDNNIKIKMPQAEIFDNFALIDSMVVYIDNESVFTNIDALEQNKIKDDAVVKGRIKAIDNGILKNAEENAKKVVEQMVKSTNQNRVIIWE